MTRMGRYEIKGKNRGKREELCIVAREATRCLKDSDMLVMPAVGSGECRVMSEKCRVKSEECRVKSCCF